MDDFKERHCKFCLTPIPISDENCEVIENVRKDTSLKLDLDEESKRLMCNACSAKWFAAETFKLTCLYTNNAIKSHVDDTTVLPLSLSYMKGRTVECISNEEIKICRLCMQPIKNILECAPINDEQVDMIQRFVPGMNVFIIKEPVMCKLCLDSLTLHYNFLKKSFDVEENTGRISNGQVSDGASTTLTSVDILVKTEDIDVEFEDVPEFIKTESLDLNYGENEDESEVNRREIFSGAAACNYETNQKSQCEEYTHEVETALEEDVIREDLSNVSMHKCTICNYEPELKYGLKQHILLHKDNSELQMYKCEKCNFATKYKSNLKGHTSRHKEMQMYKCESCTYESKYKRDCISHMLKHKHLSQLQKYKCELCNYETMYKGNLKGHMIIHKDPSEVQMYKCEKCDHETRYKRDLKSHMLIHKDRTELRMYKCGTCDYETRSKSTLTRHKVIHEDPSKLRTYKCDSCNYEATQKRYLNVHKLIHKDPSEVQMYKCKICSYEAKYKYYLKSHMLIHKDPSEVQMYKCQKCDFESKHRAALHRHILTHRKPQK